MAHFSWIGRSIRKSILKPFFFHNSYSSYCRFGVYYYTEERQEVQDRLWDEVMDEFAFAHVEKIMKSMN